MQIRLSGHGAYYHTYHIVWIPKYRRRIFKGEVKEYIAARVRQIEIYHPDVEVEQHSIQVDHVHVVMVIPPKYAVSQIVGQVKANLSRQVRGQFPWVRKLYWGGEFWSPGFFSSTVGVNEEVIRRYVEHPEKVDKGQHQLSLGF